MGKLKFEETLQRLASLTTPTPSGPESSKSSTSPIQSLEQVKARLQQIPSLLKRFSVPPKFQSDTFEVPEVLKPYQDCKKGLCLCGPAGVGKTMGVCLLARDWLRLRASQGPFLENTARSWLFLSYPEFIMELQDSYRKEGEISAHDMLMGAARRPYLIIDDLGAEKPTDYVRQATYVLINHREANMLPTFITTNFSMDHLDKNLDSRISDRIAGMGDVIRLEGKSRRLQKG